MIERRETKDRKSRYRARVYRSGGRWERGPTRASERQAKRDEAKLLLKRDRAPETCEAYVERFLAEYQREKKQSSFDTAQSALRAFVRDFGSRRLDSITRLEAKDWVAAGPSSRVPIVVTLFNTAMEDELVDRNPFRGLGRRGKGRAQMAPPTAAEFTQLLESCSVLGDYAPTMRALITFAAYTGMRPGEIFALEWNDIDLKRMRIRVSRRVYRGQIDTPKSNKPRLIALTPPARDALLTLPRRDALVFTSKRGGRLSQPTLSGYWGKVLAAAGLDFDFYLATKHYCAHYLWVKLRLPDRVVKEQLGHVDTKLLRTVYGHGDIGALEEIDAAFGQNVRQLRALPQPGDGSG